MKSSLKKLTVKHDKIDNNEEMIDKPDVNSKKQNNKESNSQKKNESNNVMNSYEMVKNAI